MMASEAELVYCCYPLTPRYSEPILEIAPSKRIGRNFEFLGIDKFDVIGETIKIICCIIFLKKKHLYFVFLVYNIMSHKQIFLK